MERGGICRRLVRRPEGQLLNWGPKSLVPTTCESSVHREEALPAHLFTSFFLERRVLSILMWFAWAAARRPGPLPLIEPVGQDQAASLSSGNAEAGFLGNCLRTGVDHTAAHGCALGLGGDQYPAHEGRASGVAVLLGEGDLSGRDVVARGEGQTSIIKLEPLCKLTRVRHEAISSAHSYCRTPQQMRAQSYISAAKHLPPFNDECACRFLPA